MGGGPTGHLQVTCPCPSAAASMEPTGLHVQGIGGPIRSPTGDFTARLGSAAHPSGYDCVCSSDPQMGRDGHRVKHGRVVTNFQARKQAECVWIPYTVLSLGSSRSAHPAPLTPGGSRHHRPSCSPPSHPGSWRLRPGAWRSPFGSHTDPRKSKAWGQGERLISEQCIS